MAYQIQRISPVYCQITDGMIGAKVTWRSHAYETLALAQKIAGRMGREEYEACSDDSFTVTEYGESAFAHRDRAWMASQAADFGSIEMPF